MEPEAAKLSHHKAFCLCWGKCVQCSGGFLDAWCILFMKPSIRGSSSVFYYLFFLFLNFLGEVISVLGQFSWGLSTKCISWAENWVRLGTLQTLSDCSKLSVKLMVNTVMEKYVWFCFAFQKDVWETQLGHMVFIESFFCGLSLQGDFLNGVATDQLENFTFSLNLSCQIW